MDGNQTVIKEPTFQGSPRQKCCMDEQIKFNARKRKTRERERERERDLPGLFGSVDTVLTSRMCFMLIGL